MRLPIAVLVVALTAPVVFAQQQATTQTPTFRAGVELVEIDATVTDASGRVVTNLTADDFEVYEDGRQQTVAAVSLVNIPAERLQRPLFAGSPIEPDVQTNTGPEGRVYLFALDEVQGEQILRTRAFVRRFIEQYFSANDVAAVVWVGRGRSSDTQDFTSNPRLLLNAIERFQGGFSSEPAPTLPTTAGQPSLAPVLSEGSFDVRSRMRSLRTLSEFMASVRGRRKAMLYFSTGLGFDMFNVTDYNGGVMNVATADAHAAMTAATRGNVAIYAIDPRGLSPDGALGDAETALSADARGTLRDSRRDLRTFSELTGGFAFTDQNNFDTAFTRIVQENSHYYVIGFYSSNERRDGRYRRLEVRTRRPGLQVRSRRGYVAPTGRAPAPAPPRTGTLTAGVATALGSPIANAGLPIKVFASPFKGPDGTASIAVAVEIDGGGLTLSEKDGLYSGRLQVATTAIGAGGTMIPGDRYDAALTLKPDTYQRVSTAGFRVITSMELPPGRYQLRVAAGDAARAGSVIYDLDVPDFAKAPLSMSGVALTAQSAAAAYTQAVKNPLRDLLPGPITAAREFSSSETLALFAEVYESGRRQAAHTIDLKAVLRADDGRVIRTVEEQRSSSELQGNAAGYGFSAQMPLTDAAPGLYVVHVEARANIGDRPLVSRDVVIRVR